MSNINPKLLWIHCNRCYTIYVYKERRLYLLACQHVICEKCCISTVGRTPGDARVYECPFCKKWVRGRQIGNDMPPHLKEMFHPEPWTDGLHHVNIEKFQRPHRQNLFKHLMKRESELKRMEQENVQSVQNGRQLFVHIKNMQAERKLLERRARSIKIQRDLEAKKRMKPTAPSLLPDESLNVGAPADQQAFEDVKMAPDFPRRGYRSVLLQKRANARNEKSESLQQDNITSFAIRPDHSFNL